MNEFDRTFFMDGIEMDVAAIDREERKLKARGGGFEEDSDEEGSGGFSNLQAARMEMERRRERERFNEGGARSRSPRVSSPVNTSPGNYGGGVDEEEDEEISPTIYDKFSEMGIGGGSGGGSDLMKQLWEEEQRKAQAYVSGMEELPWDEGEDAEPRMPSGEEFEGEVDPEALIPEDAVVPKMDTNFYSGVDNFLKSGPPPTVAGKIGGSKKKSDVEVARAVMGTDNGVKKAPRTSTKKVLAAARVGAKGTSTRRAGGAAGPKGSAKGAAAPAGPSRSLDENLLSEAFQYVNEVVVRASQEDAEEAEEAAQRAREEAFRKQEMKMARRAGGGAGASGNSKASENQNDGFAGGKVRSGGARSAPVVRKENETNNTRASSSGSGGKDTSMVKKLRNQAAAYADNDRNPHSSGGVGSSMGRNSVRASGAGAARRPGAAAVAGKKKGPVGKPVDYGSSNVFESRASGGFDTSTESKQGYGNAGGNYNRSSYKGNASGSGLREGAKTSMDMKALVNNFESGDGVAKLRAELEKSQMNMKRSEDFARQAMLDFN
jgi:hypothetical protein